MDILESPGGNLPTFTTSQWPNVHFYMRQKDQLLKRIQECLDHEKTLPEGVDTTFSNRMTYLNEYGGDAEVNGRKMGRRYRITLGIDWAPMSFTVNWEARDAEGKYNYAFCGGLVCHCSGTDPLAVSLTAQAWGIHT